jgi:hypothetical protein
MGEPFILDVLAIDRDLLREDGLLNAAPVPAVLEESAEEADLPLLLWWLIISIEPVACSTSDVLSVCMILCSSNE